MQFTHPRDVGVDDLGAVVVFLVRSGSTRAAPAPAGGDGPPPPPHSRGVHGYGQIVLVESDQADELSVIQLVRGKPHGFFLSFVTKIWLVLARCVPWEGFWRPVLQKFAKGQLLMQGR